MKKTVMAVASLLVFSTCLNVLLLGDSSYMVPSTEVLGVSGKEILLVDHSLDVENEDGIDFSIRLRSRTITAETEPLSPDEIDLDLPSLHFIVQFNGIPDRREREHYESLGMSILSHGYLHTNAWFASMGPESLELLDGEQDILWVGSIEPKDRLSPSLYGFLDGELPELRIVDCNMCAHLFITFFSDVEEEDAMGALREHPVHCGPWDPVSNGCELTMDARDTATLNRLVEEDIVQWIEPDPLPIGSEEELDFSRPDVGVDLVFASPYDLSGDNIPIMIYDSASVRDTHLGFSGRAHLTDPKGPSSDSNRTPENYTHATAVAGILCGDGSPVMDSDLSGMAPEAELYSYWKESFNTTDGNLVHNDAIDVRNVYVCHNSWGIVTTSGGPACVGTSFTDDDGFADYTSKSRWYDQVAVGSLNDPGNDRVPLIVFSAGNERDEGTGGTDPGHPDYVNFGTVNVPKTAKNVLVVGATYDDDGDPETIVTVGETTQTELYQGSNFGPCDDGRLKPELMAPGGTYQNFPGPHGDDNINTTYGVGDTNYTGFYATSLAAPHVSGIAALLVEQYLQTNGVDPNASTLRALLIHGARDIVNIDSSGTHLDGYIGPDYMTGFGHVRAKDSVDIIRDDSQEEPLILEGELDNMEDVEHSIYVGPSDDRLKVTLVWHDLEPGTANDGQAELVNDLDVVLVDPDGIVHYPYTLTPSLPLEIAKTDSPDHLNTVEQVEINNPQTGWWRVRVSGYIVPIGPQPFSLVSDLPLRTEHAPTALVLSPNGGEVLNGTVPIRWVATDANLDTLRVNISCNNGSGWLQIAGQETNDGVYDWDTTGFDDSSTYSVMVLVWDNSIDHLTALDASNATFTIYNPDPPWITLTEPQGGDVLNGSVFINWSAWDPDGEAISIGLYMSLDMVDWLPITEGEVNDGSFKWDTLEVPDETYWIKAVATDSSPYSISTEQLISGSVRVYNPDTPFVELSYPNGGERLSGEVEVNWNATDADEDALMITLKLWDKSTGDWESVAHEIMNTGSFMWNTTSLPDGSEYWLQVEVVDDSPEQLGNMDESDGSFSIYNPDPPVVSNLSMGLDEVSEMKMLVTGVLGLSWNLSDADGDQLLIDVAYRHGGDEWVNITSGQKDITSFKWDTTLVPDGADYLLRVVATDTSEFALQDIFVTEPFTIYNPDAPKVTVLSPNGGEVLAGTVNITYSASDADGEVLSVAVAYSQDGAGWTDISTGGAHTGLMAWSTLDVQDGDGYSVRVSVVDSSSYSLQSQDISNSSFRIYNPDAPLVSIITPFAGEVIRGMASVNWSATDADGEVLTISIWISSGTGDWNLLSESEENDGGFSFDTGVFENGKYLLKVVANDGLLSGEATTGEVEIKNDDAKEDGASVIMVLAGVVMLVIMVVLIVLWLLFMKKKRGDDGKVEAPQTHVVPSVEKKVDGAQGPTGEGAIGQRTGDTLVGGTGEGPLEVPTEHSAGMTGDEMGEAPQYEYPDYSSDGVDYYGQEPSSEQAISQPGEPMVEPFPTEVLGGETAKPQPMQQPVVEGSAQVPSVPKVEQQARPVEEAPQVVAPVTDPVPPPATRVAPAALEHPRS